MVCPCGSPNPRSLHVQTGLPAWVPPTRAPSRSPRNSGSSLFRPPYGYWDSSGFPPDSLGIWPLLSADKDTLFNYNSISLSPDFVKVSPVSLPLYAPIDTYTLGACSFSFSYSFSLSFSLSRNGGMRHCYGEPCIRYGKHRSVCLQQKSRRVCDSFSVFDPYYPSPSILR